jgi:hypothetical protein
LQTVNVRSRHGIGISTAISTVTQRQLSAITSTFLAASVASLPPKNQVDSNSVAPAFQRS